MLDNVPNSHVAPEHKLWLSVIAQGVTDYEYTLKRISAQFLNKGFAQSFLDDDLKTIRHHMKSEWMSDMCEYVDYHVDRVMNLLKKLDKMYKLEKVSFIKVDRPKQKPKRKNKYRDMVIEDVKPLDTNILLN